MKEIIRTFVTYFDKIFHHIRYVLPPTVYL